MQIKWIPGYEGRYAVTDDGRVASYCCHPPFGNSDAQGRDPIWLKQKWSGKPGRKRLVVGLYSDGKVKWRKVHQLVLEAFDKPRPPGLWGLHKDDNPANNHLDNLYWGTPKQNAQDAVRSGRHHCVHSKGANP